MATIITYRAIPMAYSDLYAIVLAFAEVQVGRRLTQTEHGAFHTFAAYLEGLENFEPGVRTPAMYAIAFMTIAGIGP